MARLIPAELKLSTDLEEEGVEVNTGDVDTGETTQCKGFIEYLKRLVLSKDLSTQVFIRLGWKILWIQWRILRRK